MAVARSSTSIEVPVSLGLQDANQQIAMLRKQLEESVKVDSKGFSSITKLLDSATSQAEKLGVKMSDAFKTSSGSKSFLRDYQKMLDTLTQIRSKMGNLGFEDIKFSVDDQNTINNTVKQMEELQKALDNISNGKAIDIIDRSSVDNVDILKQSIKDLSIDTAKLTFDNLRTRLGDAADEASKKLEETKQKISDIDRVTKNLDAAGLVDIQSKLNTSQGLNIKLIDDKSIDTANERLRELKAGLDDISDKTKSKLQVTQKTNDVGEFIRDQTKEIKAEYTTQLNTIGECKEQIQQALANLKTGGHIGANGRTYFTSEELTAVLNTDAMKASLAAIGLDIEQAFADMQVGQKVANLRNILTEEINKLDAREVELTGLRDGIQEKITAVFDGLTTSTVTNVGKLQKSISGILDGVEINVGDLKKFGFDVNSIQAGESLAAVYDRLKTAIEGYRDALSSESTNLNNTELVERQKVCDDLVKAIDAANKSELESGNVAEQIKAQIATLTAQVAELVKKYNELTGKKVEINLGNTIPKTTQATTAIQKYIENVTKLENKQKALSNVQMAITRWMGFYQVLNLTKRAVSDMKQHIQELDAVMTKIAVVTNMTQNDLWNQIGTYSEIARQYGVAIKGVYEVSQIYYQQGLNKGDVMGLTTETLKMARIAGIDYATAADYMTTAVRGFKLEMSDAAHVTDVFSNLAAHTASSTEELAVAISKTAASAASVGASFEATSAMMATMIATTRESATNIGTALKSIISRYGELKQNMTGTDADGEAYSLNKVDTALQSVGISIHDAAGQFRDFDDVILELAESWDTIDKNTQRYIATVMAGNRQQSRFLALVSNVEEYKRALDLANNADNAGELQVSKTLDSIDAKIERMKVTIQEFYTSSGIQDLYKGILDTITNVIRGANELPKIFGKFPALALTIGFQIVNIVKSALLLIITNIKASLTTIKGDTNSILQGIVQLFAQKGKESGEAFKDAAEGSMQSIGSKLTGLIGQRAGAVLSLAGSALSISAMSAYGASTNIQQDQAAANQMFGAAALTAGGSALSGALTGFAAGGPWGALIGGVTGLAAGLPSLISAISMNNTNLTRQIELNQKALQEAKQKETTSKGKQNELETAYNKLSGLKEASSDSAESLQEYLDYMNQLAETYPNLISSIDLAGNRIIDLTTLEEKLAEARLDTAKATYDALEKELEGKKLERNIYGKLLTDTQTITGTPGVATDTLYALLTGTNPLPYQTDKYSTIVKRYNDWAAATGKAGVSAEIQETDSLAYQWITENSELLNQFVEGTLQQIDSGEISDYSKSAYDTVQSYIANSYIKSLQTAQEEAKSANLTFDLDYIVGEDIDSLEDIKSWSYTKLQEHLQITSQRLIDYVNAATNIVDDTRDSFTTAAIELGLNNNLSKRSLNERNKLATYIPTVSKMLATRFPETQDWNLQESQSVITDIYDWLWQHQDLADELMSLDLTNISSFKSIDVSKFSSFPMWDEYVTTFENEFTQIRENALTGFDDQLKQAGLALKEIEDSTEDWLTNRRVEKINDLIGDGGLITSLLPSLRNDIKQYTKFKNEGLEAEAENYLTAFLSVYDTINTSFSDEQQATLQPFINNLDLTDSESIKSTISQLEALDPELYGDLIEKLRLANMQLAYNIQASTLQLRDQVAEITKNVETGLEKLSKGVKLSEALSSFNELIDNYTGTETFTFDQIYTWDESLHGYVLSLDGLNLWLENTTKEYTDKIDELSTQLDNTLSMYSTFSDFDIDKNNFDPTYLIRKSLLEDHPELEENEQELQARTKAAVAQYERLKKEYTDRSEKEQDLTWAQWLTNKKQILDEQTKSDIQFYEGLIQDEFTQQLRNVDYKAIAGGTANKNERQVLETILEKAGVSKDKLGEAFDDVWARILEGDFEAFNDILASANVDFTVSGETAAESMRAEYEQYEAALDEIFTKPISLWSDATKELAGIDENTDLSTVDIGALASQFLTEILILVSRGAASIEEQNESVLKVIKQREKDLGIGREKEFYDAVKDGFTTEELDKLGGFDENGELIPELRNILKQDSTTGNFKVIAKGTATEVLAALANALGIALNTTSDEYKDAVTMGIDEGIKSRESANKGKQIAKTLQNIASASIGDEININALDTSMKQALGLDAAAETLTIESEKRRDALLLLLESSVAAYEGEGKEALQAIYNSIKSSIESKTSSSRMTGLSGMLSTTVDKSAAKSYLESWGYENLSDADIQSMMKSYGYEWDNFAQTFRAGKQTLVWAKERLKEAEAKGASEESINELQRLVSQLSHELSSNPARDALVNLLSDYANVSDNVLEEFAAQFDIDIDKYVITEKNGTKKVDVEALSKVLGENWSEYFDEVIRSIADEYISNAEKASSLITEGTMSQTEMTAFQTAYKDLMGAEIEFIYDPVLQSWTFDIIHLKSYLQAAAAKMGLDTDSQAQWVASQIEAMTTDALDFSSYISGDITTKDTESLKRTLTNYFKTHTSDFMPYMGTLEEWALNRTESTLKAISEGGQLAVNTLKSIKGELTADEVEAAYRAQLEPIKAISDSIDELQAGSVVAKNQIDALRRAGFEVNKDGLITSTGNLVEAYKSLYQQMEETNVATIAELNSMMGKYLDNRDGEQKVIDALSNANNMTFSQLADIYTQEGIILTETMVDELEAAGVIKSLGGDKMMISDFKTFAQLMNWQPGSEEYLNAYKAYNDGLIEMDHAAEKAIGEELNSILDADLGGKVNLTKFADLIGEDAINAVVNKYGGFLKDGILTLSDNADIGHILTELANVAEEAGAMIPSELEELRDAIAQLLADMTKMIADGIGGTVDKSQARDISRWASNYGVNVDFHETAEGFQITTNSARELYNVVKDLDSLQGEVVFEALKDNIIETDERFRSVNSEAAYIASLESEVRYQDQLVAAQKELNAAQEEGRKAKIAAFEGLKGKVDMYNRPWVDNADGSHSTILSTSYTNVGLNDQEVHMLLTPVPEWAEVEADVLSTDELDQYFENLMAQNPLDVDTLLELDAKGMEINGKHFSNMIIDIKDATKTSIQELEREEQELHEWSDSWEKIRKKKAEPDNPERIAALKEELALAQKIAEARGLTESDSFKFMEQDIPSGQNNPLNYWENWQKAFAAMDAANTGASKGKMAYQDFYNIVTEMGNLASITGQAIPLGEQTVTNAETAAALIEQAAGALEVQQDGSLKINLSKIGVDFANGADAMTNSVDDGIHAIAKSQIEMLDSLIGLLETIVTMEDAFKNMDVESDGKLSIGELFEVDDDGNVQGFKHNWEDALANLRDMLDPAKLDTYNKDFARGMESIKFTINDKMLSLADVIKMDFADVMAEGGIGPEFYTALMDSIYQAAQDGDFSETNIKELIMEHLQKGLEGTGAEITFDMGNYTFIGTGHGNFEVDWGSDATAAAMAHMDADLETEKQKLIEAYRARAEGNANTTQLEATLIADKVITIKDGKISFVGPDGNTYTSDGEHASDGYSEALAAMTLKDLDDYDVQDIKMGEAGSSKATGTITMGQTKFTVTSDNGQITYSDESGQYTGNSPNEVIYNKVQAQLDEEEAAARNAGAQYDRKGRELKLMYKARVEAGIESFELNSQSYQNVAEDSRKRLEDALASGNSAEIELAIKADPKLASLEGLSSSEIEEKLGLKAVKLKFDTSESLKAIEDIDSKIKAIKMPELTLDINDNPAQKKLDDLKKRIEELQVTPVDGDTSRAVTAVNELRAYVTGTPVSQNIQVGSNTVPAAIVTNVVLGAASTVFQNVQVGSNGSGSAAGNVGGGAAKAQGTLMGELGPELVVSNGRYFIVGQNGAEFVNLEDDAIVFNHLQTEQLLKKGMSSTRGRAVTNEQNAVSFAHGNVNGGFAMASASAVLAQLKQLRAMWESLLGASAKDLVGKAGSGGGGGGGKENAVDPAFIKQLERWYNLLQDIATLEEKINYQENLRKKISGSYIGRNGKDYYNSQKQSLKLLEEEIQKHQQLVKEQKEYYKLRQAQLNSQSAFSSLYTFDDDGQIKYKPGKFEELTAMFSANPTTGKPNHTVEEQYNYLMHEGYGYAMQYDSEGNKIDTSTAEGKQQAIQAFWDKIEADQNEMQGLHDSITEHENAILEAQEQQNEILKEIEDNQIALENQVLDAIVDAAQREIDAIQDEKDALEKSNQEFLDGLNDALQKERDMYASQQNEADLMNKRRRLSLLQRTGGSASEISSLQAEIDDATRDLYFEKQQEQIDAIQAASDAQLEKLQQQIDLAQESLEYQKEHGLLWEQVYEQMAKSPEEIAQFIEENDSKHWAESPTQFAQSNREILFQAQQWRAFAEDTSNKTVEDLLKSIQKEIKDKLKSESSGSSSSGGSGSGGGGGGSSGGSSDSGSGGGGSGGGNANGNTPSSTPPTTTWTRHAKLTYINTDYGQKVVTGTGTSKTSIAEAQANALADAKSKAAGFRDTVNVSYYSAGGLNDYTGLAMLHGTPSKPEAVLNAAQTSILRNEILGHGKDSLLNLLQDFRTTYSNMATGSDYSSVDSSSSVVIEHAEVNMKVDKLANSYDAARAGDDVMREILNIARKTGTQNRVGR